MSAQAQTPPPPARDASAPLLRVSGLTVGYRGADGREVRIVDDVSFTLARGEALGLAGESGCGKTTTALALLGLLPAGLERTAGEMVLEAREGTVQLHRRTERGMQQVRWRSISMIFQGAMNALDPVMRVSSQLAEAIRLHQPGADGRTVGKRIAELFDQVGISPARARQYPHEFSGGMRQRVMIALALACGPEVVIADEPTTALDVMMQAQVLELLESLRRDLGLALILITHDLVGARRDVRSHRGHVCGPDRGARHRRGGVRARGAPLHAAPPARLPRRRRPARAVRADSGRAAGSGCAAARMRVRAALPRRAAGVHADRRRPARGRPGHHARCLFAPWPHGGTGMSAPLATDPLFETRGLHVHFHSRGGRVVRALDGVDLRWRARGGARHRRGIRLRQVDAGTHAARTPAPERRRGTGITASPCRGRRASDATALQMVFQDPYQSLNPRMTAADQVRSRSRCTGSAAAPTASAGPPRPGGVWLAPVERFWDRYPHELSGGQRQRVAIAAHSRPTAGIRVRRACLVLDVSVRAQVLSLLAGLRRSADSR